MLFSKSARRLASSSRSGPEWKIPNCFLAEDSMMGTGCVLMDSSEVGRAEEPSCGCSAADKAIVMIYT